MYPTELYVWTYQQRNPKGEQPSSKVTVQDIRVGHKALVALTARCFCDEYAHLRAVYMVDSFTLSKITQLSQANKSINIFPVY